MKRGKRFLENDKMLIYVGTAVFIVLAIALGIIMYMMNRTATKLENGSSQQVGQGEQNVGENAESVSTEMGKTVEEQQNSESENDGNREGKQELSSGDSSSSKNTTSAEKSSNSSNSGDSTKSNNSSKTASSTNNEKNKVTEPKSNQADEPDTITNAPAKNEGTEVKTEVSFVKPTEGEIICEYAKDNLIYSETLKEWITHTAVDIKADKTSVIKSAADGIIKSIVNDPRYGLTVVIGHDDGYETVYSNLLTAEFVVVGEEVSQGQTIGTAGNTAAFESNMECHLHFELLKDGECLDPSIYLK